ncbi:MAG: aquaporin family protein [Gammaproteobacteria bacterium]|nr:MAG: aquaporin family protein [Gammaproteobacteria bacterium]TDJ39393.1 MAG: aquaporin family protein [Gammaproteobacteria bacterium]
MTASISRRLTAELLGTLLLVATVVGSGIMAENLAGGNLAIALLANAIATGAILVVLILMFQPISGAHFNPAVSFAFLLRGELALATAGLYVLAQIVGGLLGSVTAHLMFELDPLQLSTRVRTGSAQWFAEFVAAFGLVATILTTVRFRPDAVAYAVGLFITAGYWFTASTSFANPAVAIARAFTDTFSGIRGLDVPGFILAELVGAAVAVWLVGWLLRETSDEN